MYKFEILKADQLVINGVALEMPMSRIGWITCEKRDIGTAIKAALVAHPELAAGHRALPMHHLAPQGYACYAIARPHRANIFLLQWPA